MRNARAVAWSKSPFSLNAWNASGRAPRSRCSRSSPRSTAAGPEDVVEVGAAVARHDLAAAARSSPSTRSRTPSRPSRAPASACASPCRGSDAARYSTVTKPWLNCSAFLIFSTSADRDHLARLVVLRVDLQHLGLERPVLHDLRRQLDEVAREPAEAPVRALRQERVQRVAELVEQRARPLRASAAPARRRPAARSCRR